MGGGGGLSLYVIPPSQVLKDSGAGSAANKGLYRNLSGAKGDCFLIPRFYIVNTENFMENLYLC